MKKKNVLVGVLKNKDDLDILLKKHWYRIPEAFLPGRKFDFVAFYQPASFGKSGKKIEYYGRVSNRTKVKRVDLLPHEVSHPRANKDYLKIKFSKIQKLAKPVRNIIPRRVSFGYTDLESLRSAGNILELYGVPLTEQLVEKHLNRMGIDTVREFNVSCEGKRYRIDIAIFCKNGKIAIECDNKKAHSGKARRRKDKLKDSFLRRHGWKVIRLKERDIMEDTVHCVKIIEKTIKRLSKYVRCDP